MNYGKWTKENLYGKGILEKEKKVWKEIMVIDAHFLNNC